MNTSSFLLFATGCSLKFVGTVVAAMPQQRMFYIVQDKVLYRLIQGSLFSIALSVFPEMLTPILNRNIAQAFSRIRRQRALPRLTQGGSSNPDQTNCMCFCYWVVVIVRILFDVVSDEPEYDLTRC